MERGQLNMCNDTIWPVLGSGGHYALFKLGDSLPSTCKGVTIGGAGGLDIFVNKQALTKAYS